MNKKNEKPTVALIWGGEGQEHDVSCLGAEYVGELIDGTKYELCRIYIDKKGVWHLDGEDGAPVYPLPTDDGGGIRVKDSFIRLDAAIPLLHGDMGEDGAIQGALRTAHIPFVGADTVTGAVCIDKGYTKAVASSLGIPTAKGRYYVGEDLDEFVELAEGEVGYPMFVKPARLGSSIGAAPVRSRAELCHAFEQAKALGSGRILIEELLEDKRELELAYFSVPEQTIISHPAEVLSEGFYSYESKYKMPTKTLTRAELPQKICERMQEYSARLVKALGLRHLARIDFFLVRDRLLFNEINTMPGFTKSSLYPRIIEAHGIDPKRLVSLLVDDALREGGIW